MALKRLLRWGISQSDWFKYFSSRRNICCTRQYNCLNQKEKMSLEPKTVYIRKDVDNIHFDVSISVDYPPLELNKIVNIRRSLDSPLTLLLQRINLKIYALLEKKKSKKMKLTHTGIEYPSVNALLYLDEKQLANDTVCSEIFELNGRLVFQIFNDSYSVYVNFPWIHSIILPKHMTSNMVLHPVKFSSVYCDVDKSLFKWFKSEKTANSKTFVVHMKDWVEIGNGFFYRVTENEVGHYIKLECTPKNDKDTGPTFTVTNLTPVEQGEFCYYYVNTHKLTKESASENKVRIITYNILASMYTSTKEAKSMYDYCPSFVLEKCQRFPAITCEIAGYNGDLICLQEVELNNFETYLMKQLKELGYLGFISLKTQEKEGTACIFKENKFDILGMENFVISHEIMNNPHLEKILKYSNQQIDFYQKITTMPHSLQMIALRSKEKKNEALIVGNVHLYSLAEADLIRLIQILSSFYLFQSFLKQYESALTDLNTTFILCGDFNSTPDSPIHQMIMSGSLSSEDSVWETILEMKDYKGLSFDMPVKMESACGTPEFTNYTRGFKGCLDYIYYQTGRLEVDKIYPLPSEAVLSENIGLPSVAFPSDHIPLIVDMKWKY